MTESAERNMKFGAIDIGTNAARLLVGEVEHEGGHVRGSKLHGMDVKKQKAKAELEASFDGTYQKII